MLSTTRYQSTRSTVMAARLVLVAFCGWRAAGGLALADLNITTSQTYNGAAVNGTLNVNAAGNPLLTITSANNLTASKNAVDVIAGNANLGRITLNSGGILVNSGLGYIGQDAGSTGVVTVGGTNSRWTSTGLIVVGSSGTGTLTVNAGGLVEAPGGLYVGRLLGSENSVLTVTGSNAVIDVERFYVGTRGEATATITNGGTVNNANGYGAIAFWPESVATMTVGGGTGTSTWNNNEDLYIGGSATDAGGSGTLTVNTGGVVNVTGAHTTKLWNAGTLLIDGGTFTTGSLDRTAGTVNHHDGTLKINGGAYTQASGALIVAGNAAGKNPLFNFSGNGTTTGVEALVIGRTGNTQDGSLRIEAGRVLNITGNNTVTTTLDGVEIRRGNSYLGLNAGATGAATVTGAGSAWSNTERLYVGYGGTGNLSVEAGATVTSKMGLISFNSGSLGTANVTGSGSKWTASQFMFVGYNGYGTLNTTAGGEVATPEMYVGIFSGGSGTASVSGAGSVWNVSSALYLAGNSLVAGGTGSLSIANAGQVNVTGITKLWNAATLTLDGGALHTTNFDRTVGTVNHHDGTLRVNGGSYSQANGMLIVAGNAVGKNPLLHLNGAGTNTGIEAVIVGQSGNSQNGQLLIDAGRVVAYTGNGTSLGSIGASSITNGFGYLGLNAGSTGTASVTGSGSKWNISDYMLVGVHGSGTLNVQAGGEMSNSFGHLGYITGSSGTATITDVGSKWINTRDLTIGRQGSGTLHILAGGIVTNDAGLVGSNSGSIGTVTVSGSGSTWNNNSDLYLGGLSFSAGGSGSLIITNSGQVNVAGITKLWASGALTVDGGTLNTSNFDGTVRTVIHLDGTFKVNGGFYTQATGALIVAGNALGKNPLLHLSGNGTTTGIEAVVIGLTGNTQNGQLLIDAGRVVNNTGNGTLLTTIGVTSIQRGNGYVGLNAGSTGTVTVTGVGSKLNYDQAMNVGIAGTGNLNITSSAEVSGTFGVIGGMSGSTGTGTAIVDGIGSKWTSTNTLTVGQGGTATLSILNGGQVISPTGRIGDYYSHATATVNGAGSKWTTSSQLYVGSAGTGVLNIENGGEVSGNSQVIIGTGPNGTGTVTLTGATSKISNYYTIFVGLSGNGTLQINGGGTATTTFGQIANNSGSVGTATITGPGSKWTTTQDLSIGGSEFSSGGNGTLAITNGGQVNVAGITKLWNAGTLGLNGGTLQTGRLEAASASAKIQLTGNANTLELTGGTSSFSGTVEGTGGLSKTGAGILTFTGPNTYAGGTTVGAGTLRVGTGGTVGTGPVTNNAMFDVTSAGAAVSSISGTGTTTVTASGATLTANHIRQSTLNIGAGNTVTIASNGTDTGTSTLTNLNINATGKLDLNDNDLVVDNGNLATLTAQLASGLDINGSYGNGPGITSTAFANNVDFNTVLGIAANVELGYTSFSGQTVDANDILIKYTYYGDADLSGSVDTSTDFDLYITGLTSGGSLGGWLYGDFDYSGTVDSSTDFDLYITGLTSQTGPLLNAGGGSPVTAVPEPSTFVLAGLGLVGFAGLRLRRRRNL